MLVFAVLTALWCLLAWWLTRAPGLGTLLQRHGTALMPLVLIAVGGLILLHCNTFHDPGLAFLVLAALVVMVLSLMRQLQLLRHASPHGALPQP